MRHSARLVAYSGWGEISPPAFAFDLTGRDLKNSAPKATALRRYGKAPTTVGDADSRPIGLPFTFNTASFSWSAVTGGALQAASVVGAFAQWDTTVNVYKSYVTSTQLSENQSFYLRAFLYEHAQNQNSKIHRWRWGSMSATHGGFFFQVRDGRPEIAVLSREWNQNDQNTLDLLWRLSAPSIAESVQIETLQKKLYESLNSLSFGRDSWFGNAWTLCFVPEPRGVLHVILIGGGEEEIEIASIINTRSFVPLWTQTPVRMDSYGGAFWMQCGTLRFARSGSMEFGPFDTGYFEDALGDVTFAHNSDAQPGKTAVEFGMHEYEGYAINFGFKATLRSLNLTQTPFLYGLSARLAPGERIASDEISFDTAALYQPIGADGPLETSPFLDVSISFDGAFNQRSARVTMRDIQGRTTTAAPALCDRVATLWIDEQPVLTEGIIEDMRFSDMASVRQTIPGNHTHRSETTFDFLLCDGWKILRETFCDPPPIGDNMPLGAAARQLLKIAGFRDAQLAGIAPGAGKRLARAALGEDWAERPSEESTCADALRALFESYGFGWRFYQDRNGVWQMKRVVRNPALEFKSDAANNSPLTPQGRLTILQPLDVSFDSRDFYNDFTVIGGEKGELRATWTSWESIRRPDWPTWIGRKKSYPVLRNSGLRTSDDVQYALRSLTWLYGRNGRRATFDSYFNTSIEPGDVFKADGLWWEVLGSGGASMADDVSQFELLEVV